MRWHFLALAAAAFNFLAAGMRLSALVGLGGGVDDGIWLVVHITLGVFMLGVAEPTRY